MMYHLVAGSIGDRVLFHHWGEALWLWDAVLHGIPDPVAFALMPTHVHVIHRKDVREQLAAALAGFTRARNHARGERGPLFRPLPPAEVLESADKISRQIRYVHLNPCRDRLVGDPLTWPFSTHRDACGLAVPRVVPRVNDPDRFHRHVSSDPDCRVDGTELPTRTTGSWTPHDVLRAVSAVTRSTRSMLSQRGPARALYLRSATELCPRATRDVIGKIVGVKREAVLRATKVPDPNVHIIARVVGDLRFRALHERTLPWALPLEGWEEAPRVEGVAERSTPP
jgi:hypothetical protein